MAHRTIKMYSLNLYTEIYIPVLFPLVKILIHAVVKVLRASSWGIIKIVGES